MGYEWPDRRDKTGFGSVAKGGSGVVGGGEWGVAKGVGGVAKGVCVYFSRGHPPQVNSVGSGVV